MKKIVLLFLFILFGLNETAFASHFFGSEISYLQLSPNTYQATLKIYRDCTGTGVTAPVNIQLNAPGCNSGRLVPLALVSTRINKPYGALVPVSCTSTSTFPNYQILTYSGQFTFSAAEAACSDWVLSWAECCRPVTANLVGQDNLYTEANLKLIAGVVNSSPAFDTLHAPALLAYYNLVHNLSMAAIDPDGDSLVYKLDAPLANANTPVPYKPYLQQAASIPGLSPNIIINPNPRPPYSVSPFNPQVALITGSPVPAVFNPQFPMPSIVVDWNGPPTIPYPSAPNGLIWEARQLFELNAVNGELRFSPSRYVAGASAASGENKYTVTITVEEYRKINGVMTKLGFVRRETMIEVTGYHNGIPYITSSVANNQSIQPDHEIKLRPGTPLALHFSGTDPDNQTVDLTTNATYILPGSSFVASPGSGPVGSITWVPTAADVRWQPYFIQVMFRDDASILRGVHIETFAIRVSHTGSVTNTPEAFREETFVAYPNPFSEQLHFKLNLHTKAESLKIYNLLGQQIDEIKLQHSGLGEQHLQWKNAGKYAAGTYVAKLISQDKKVQILKFTKLQ